MLFTSIEWLLFLTAVFVFFHVVPERFRRWVMLGSSLVFYASWKWPYLALIVAHILADWTCGHLLGRAERPLRRKLILTGSVVFNLLSLSIFKFYGLFTGSLSYIGLHLPSFSLELPLGISFFAFESLSYTIDVYRRKLKPLKSPLHLALFVSWFPHLISGPIIRPSDMVKQLGRQLSVTRERFWSGMELMVRGYAKKLLIADWLAKVADPVFAHPNQFTSLETLIAVYAYAFQIYCDFSAYTDIARGASRWFGIELPENFAHPYESESITEFWRRWHMTLSHWLRDYLYIPLGGNRKGTLRTYLNLMITMLLGGLWHGASWTFMVWGGLHGLYLAAERALGVRSQMTNRGFARLARQILTFHLVCFSWIMFRNHSFASAREMLASLAAGNWWISVPQAVPMTGALLLVGFYFLASWSARKFELPDPGPRIGRQIAYATGLGFILVVFMVLGATSNAFIYFQF